MGKKISAGKMAMLGAASGFMQGMLIEWQTARAQEAERIKEERLAAIRAGERQQEHAFRKDEIEQQHTRASERDAANRDHDMGIKTADISARAAEQERSAATQREVASIHAKPRQQLFVDAEGNQHYLPEGSEVPAGWKASAPSYGAGGRGGISTWYDPSTETYHQLQPGEDPLPHWVPQGKAPGIKPPAAAGAPPAVGGFGQQPTLFGVKPTTPEEHARAAAAARIMMGGSIAPRG